MLFSLCECHEGGRVHDNLSCGCVRRETAQRFGSKERLCEVGVLRHDSVHRLPSLF